MLKTICGYFCAFMFFIPECCVAQGKKPEDFGFKHLRMVFKGDTADILLKSRKGEEHLRKPLFLFCQGSMPQPLIKYDNQGLYGVFPFGTDSLEKEYHLAIVGKPHIPVVADVATLDKQMGYVDAQTGKYPSAYSRRNYLEYYVDRNIAVIAYLHKHNYINPVTTVVAGHSEGSTVAAMMALKSKKVTQLIYSSGNPLGRIQSIISQRRLTESDSTRYAEDEMDYWNYVCENAGSTDDSNGDTPKATFGFSYPPIRYLEKLTIPVLVCYGTKDVAVAGNDYLRIDMIRNRKRNFSFKAYIGLEHNFFPLDDSGRADYSKFNWNRVASDWREWLLSAQLMR
ncbi:MAG: hypothetical protein JNL32_07280 [Candidatus Kapabacteria bacterium]|nr:hypothetical protein [Candidatus Kapabacteria bacterium]